MEVFIGTVQAFGFNFAPLGWAQCQGQMMPIPQYTALFALLGTYYGGDGQTTFGLPNLQGRTIVGQGTNAGEGYEMGQIAGNTTVTLTQAEMPMHTHSATEAGGEVQVAAPAYEDTGNTNAPGPGTVLAQPTSGNLYSTEESSTTMKAGTGAISGVNIQVGLAGGSQAVNIENPYLAMNYCIALEGIFPSRN